MATDIGIRSGKNAARELRATMHGRIVLPDASSYESARQIWNGAVDHRPAVIAYCESVADVQAAVRVARDHQLPLSVRGGGHDWAGRSVRPDGLVLDLSRMRQIEIDPGSQMARVAGGATLGDLARAAAPLGFAAATGTVNPVGVAGFMLAGGYGPLLGKVGLGLDNLVSAEVVLADGRQIVTDAHEHPDLFWALRGGGGNFGVVTSMRVRLHRVPEVLTGAILFPLAEGESVLRGLDETVSQSCDDLTVLAGVFPGPGGPVMMLVPTWSGERRRGEEAIARLQRLGTPIVAQVLATTCVDMLNNFDNHIVNGRHYHIQTRWLASLSREAISVILEAGSSPSSPLSVIAIHSFHGAGTRVGGDATAFGLRKKHFMVEIIAAWEPGSGSGQVHRDWAKSLSVALEPFAIPGGYANLLGPSEQSQIAHAYGENRSRLLEIKQRFDPENVFSATALPR
ncbi:MAG: FAD-binding oxidoreductase [Pseudomonadota bacterium]